MRCSRQDLRNRLNVQDPVFIVHVCGLFCSEYKMVPLLTSWKHLDQRGDPVVRAGVLAQKNAMDREFELPKESVATIGVTLSGCQSHLDTVVKSAQNKKTRPGFFIRAGHQAIATYAAMAVQTHGPTFTWINHGLPLQDLFDKVDDILSSNLASHCFIIFSTGINSTVNAACLLLSLEAKSEVNKHSSIPLSHSYETVFDFVVSLRENKKLNPEIQHFSYDRFQFHYPI